jgi:hypothetical protein
MKAGQQHGKLTGSRSNLQTIYKNEKTTIHLITKLLQKVKNEQ